MRMKLQGRADYAQPLVSGRAYARLLQSPSLRRHLLPEGLFPSPYIVLDYDATLTLSGTRGIRATFARRQTVCFQQDRVGALLDHAWGDGVLLTDYHTDTTSAVVREAVAQQVGHRDGEGLLVFPLCLHHGPLLSSALLKGCCWHDGGQGTGGWVGSTQQAR